MLHNKNVRALLAAAALSLTSPAFASGVYITEWMYNGAAEYVEFTNLSGSTIDFSGWSYDDDSRTPGVFSLSGFGEVANGESVIITEIDAEQFRVDWNIAESVKILGGYTNNLGRNDEINVYDNFNTLIDRLTYGDQTFAGTIRTAGISGRLSSNAALGANDIYQWIFSSVGDADGSYYSLNGELGSPGLATVPVPAAGWLMMSGLLAMFGLQRRRRNRS